MNESSDIVPYFFRKIVGQSGPKEILFRFQTQNRIPASLCFTGPSGIGKKTIGLNFIAKDLCSMSQKEIFSGCGKCPSCIKIANKNHPDFLFLEPQGITIKIDQIRELIKWCSFHSFHGKKRWILIDQAHLMTTQAQNSLLKTLEEPPSQCHFILISDSYEALLPTIRSRCQLVRFHHLSLEQVMDVLKSLPLDHELQKPLAILSNGSPGYAFQIAEEEIVEIRKYILETLCKILQKNNKEEALWLALVLSKKISQEKQQKNLILRILQSFLRDLGFLKLGMPQEKLFNQDYFAQLRRLDKVSIDRILNGHRILTSLERDFRYNSNLELSYNRVFQNMIEIVYA